MDRTSHSAKSLAPIYAISKGQSNHKQPSMDNVNWQQAKFLQSRFFLLSMRLPLKKKRLADLLSRKRDQPYLVTSGATLASCSHPMYSWLSLFKTAPFSRHKYHSSLCGRQSEARQWLTDLLCHHIVLLSSFLSHSVKCNNVKFIKNFLSPPQKKKMWARPARPTLRA